MLNSIYNIYLYAQQIIPLKEVTRTMYLGFRETFLSPPHLCPVILLA